MIYCLVGVMEVSYQSRYRHEFNCSMTFHFTTIIILSSECLLVEPNPFKFTPDSPHHFPSPLFQAEPVIVMMNLLFVQECYERYEAAFHQLQYIIHKIPRIFLHRCGRFETVMIGQFKPPLSIQAWSCSIH